MTNWISYPRTLFGTAVLFLLALSFNGQSVSASDALIRKDEDNLQEMGRHVETTNDLIKKWAATYSTTTEIWNEHFFSPLVIHPDGTVTIRGGDPLSYTFIAETSDLLIHEQPWNPELQHPKITDPDELNGRFWRAELQLTEDTSGSAVVFKGSGWLIPRQYYGRVDFEATGYAPTDPPSSTPTEAPITPSPTEAPTTPSPTEAPTTPSPTEDPTTPSPTEDPTTLPPTEDPTPLPSTTPSALPTVDESCEEDPQDYFCLSPDIVGGGPVKCGLLDLIKGPVRKKICQSPATCDGYGSAADVCFETCEQYKKYQFYKQTYTCKSLSKKDPEKKEKHCKCNNKISGARVCFGACDTCPGDFE